MFIAVEEHGSLQKRLNVSAKPASPASSTSIRGSAHDGCATSRHRGHLQRAQGLVRRRDRSGPKKLEAIHAARIPPPSSNYVVFNPGIVDILKKYGIAGAAAPLGMGALAASDKYETQ